MNGSHETLAARRKRFSPRGRRRERITILYVFKESSVGSVDEKRLELRECLHRISFRSVRAQVLRRMSFCRFSFTLPFVLGEALFQTLIFFTKRDDFSLELAHFNT